MISTVLALLPAIQLALALAVGVRKRAELTAAWQKTPGIAKVGIIALLIAGALIPGPIDDIVIAAMIVRIGARA